MVITYNNVNERQLDYYSNRIVDLISFENLSSDTILKNAHPKTPFPYDMFVGSRYAFMNLNVQNETKNYRKWII